MTSRAEREVLAIRAGGDAAAGAEGVDLVAGPALASVRAYPDLDALDAAMEADPRVYRRHGNSTVAMLEGVMAALEQPEGGEAPLAKATASGQAALLLLVSAAMTTGRRRVVLLRPCYGGTESLLIGPLAGMGVATTFVDLPPPPVGCDETQRLAAVLDTDVALVVAEVVTNPLLSVVDIPAVSAAARAVGALTVVDSTLPTPFLFQPLAHGADMVLHSLTKHLGGHSDVLGGVALVAPGSDAHAWLDAHSRSLGAVLSPFDAWLSLRGLRTAPLRVRRGTETAKQLAAALAVEPRLLAVHYPGFRGAADAEVTQRLLPDGAGPMLSLDLRGGLAAAGRAVRALRGIRLAPSLGDVSTTVSHPATTSHRNLSAQQRAALGISDGLLRFSIGVEDPDVLLAELTAAIGATS